MTGPELELKGLILKIFPHKNFKASQWVFHASHQHISAVLLWILLFLLQLLRKPLQGSIVLPPSQISAFRKTLVTSQGYHGPKCSEHQTLKRLTQIFIPYDPHNDEVTPGHMLKLKEIPHFPFICLSIYFAVLGLEIRTYTTSHSSSPFCVSYFRDRAS
jgi:hypothetical protein